MCSEDKREIRRLRAKILLMESSMMLANDWYRVYYQEQIDGLKNKRCPLCKLKNRIQEILK